MLYYTVYQITNLINGHFYIGKHTTTDPYDNYFGSSEVVENAIKKYGRDNFKKYILFYCNSEEEAFEIEGLIANEDVVAMDECYNIKIGGDSGPKMLGEDHPLYGKNRTEEDKNKMKGPRNSIKGENHPNFGGIYTPKGENNPLYGRTRSEMTGDNHPKPWLEKNNPEQSIRMKENNPSKREDVKLKHSINNLGENNGRSQPISINDIQFNTIKDAAKYFNKARCTIHKWLKQNKYNSYYLGE